jgi:hypothetical protein
MAAEHDQIKALTARDPYGALGLDNDPDLAFAGIRALRHMADFCESYQVRRLRQASHTWADIAGWAGVSPQALHKKHAGALRDSEAASK